MSETKTESNPILDSALSHEFQPYRDEKGVKRVVAFGEYSHKCPTYVTRIPPCTTGCPAGEDIRGFHNLLTGVEKSDDIWEAAWRRIVDKNPFPAVMGRVCPHPCETACNRVMQDEAVGINSVEHAIGDYGIAHNLKLEPPQGATGKHIAVIGAGPAGLSAAYQLTRKGHQVTVFDERLEPGGMMRYGIMEYRVGREVLDAEISRILALGVKTRMNTRVGSDITLEQLKEQYDAIFVGVGAQKGAGLPVPGFDASEDATNAIDLLADYEANGLDMHIGRNVIVVGDGDVSMDAARLAVRMGVPATLLSAVPRNEMSCSAVEYEDAVKEGTVMEELISVSEVFTKDGKVTGVRCVKMEKKEQGEEGFDSPVPFFRYKPVPGSEFEMPCDMIVAAIGQRTDMGGLESVVGDGPFLHVEKDFRIKGEEKVFGGGDAIRIELITTAVGHGRKAADAIDNFLKGVPAPHQGFQDVIGFDKLYTYYFKESAQLERPHLEFDDIKGNFEETLKSLDPESVIEESKRCMSCGLCFECRQCMIYCPQEAISYFKNNGVGEVMFTDYNKCVGCHICAQVCPTGFIHMGMGEDL